MTFNKLRNAAAEARDAQMKRVWHQNAALQSINADLLAALEAILPFSQAITLTSYTDITTRTVFTRLDACTQARAAIAKARGAE